MQAADAQSGFFGIVAPFAHMAQQKAYISIILMVQTLLLGHNTRYSEYKISYNILHFTWTTTQLLCVIQFVPPTRQTSVI